MIIEYKNDEGYIYGYISWNTATKENVLCDNGEVVLLNGIWIHPDYRGNGMMKKMITDAFRHKTTQKSLYISYHLGKRKDREVNLRPISRYIKYLEE